MVTYKKKLFIYLSFVFVVFTGIIIVVQYGRERSYRIENLRANLSIRADMIEKYCEGHGVDSVSFVLGLLPAELRLTVMDGTGRVLFDNAVGEGRQLENHRERPEISSAILHREGMALRYSETYHEEYYYYAMYNGKYVIRVALPYNTEVKESLKGDTVFVYTVLVLFFVAGIALFYLSNRFGAAISGLNEFITSAENDRPDYDKIQFPDTELGEIGGKIVANYRLLKRGKDRLKQEQEKLLRHFHYSEEGICIFSPEGVKIYANTHFVQYLNIILDEPGFEPASIFREAEFEPAYAFLRANTPVNPKASVLPVYQNKLFKNGKYFDIKLIVFTDNSFEIVLNHISTKEKTRILKQEMTNNIAHELKTPVSSIRGYLETVLEQPNIDRDKERFFLERAYSQALRLSDLIRDVALITKIEEAAGMFAKSAVRLKEVAEEAVNELRKLLMEHRICITDNIGEEAVVEGNRTLLFSIFRNLIENVVDYAGSDISIGINLYGEDEEYYYFSFYDTGRGVEERHLNKLFDRFYRAEEGRSRKYGGTGLGLAIVKNAVLLHGGQITAKRRKEGGLEFVFSLAKRRTGGPV